MSRERLEQAGNAPVAQWIEQRFPKPRAHVRFVPGALSNLLSIAFLLLSPPDLRRAGFPKLMFPQPSGPCPPQWADGTESTYDVRPKPSRAKAGPLV